MINFLENIFYLVLFLLGSGMVTDAVQIGLAGKLGMTFISLSLAYRLFRRGP